MARELTTTYSCQKSVQIVSGFTQAVRLAGLALGGFVFAVLVLAVFGATVFGRTETVFGRCCMVACVDSRVCPAAVLGFQPGGSIYRSYCGKFGTFFLKKRYFIDSK